MASNQGKYLNFCLIATNNKYQFDYMSSLDGEFNEWRTGNGKLNKGQTLNIADDIQ